MSFRWKTISEKFKGAAHRNICINALIVVIIGAAHPENYKKSLRSLHIVVLYIEILIYQSI